jgi:tocopherol O-methyltransferase
MQITEYHQKIVDYYTATENAYKDSWDLENSLAIHYGYWDKKVKSFSQSLIRMNEVMAAAVAVTSGDTVLDAGCGVGGGSIFLAEQFGCNVVGITLSERQMQQANSNARKRSVDKLANFRIANYSATDFLDNSFDVIWCCESICYASDKQQFVKEAYRLLKPGGRIVVADGFVTQYLNNRSNTIRRWLDGWEVNNLESPVRFENLLELEGFTNVNYKNISKNVAHSSLRLLKYYFFATLWLWWKTITFSNKATPVQRKNIKACWYQYWGLKFRLWQYGLFTATRI